MLSRRVALFALLLFFSTPSSHPQDTPHKLKMLPVTSERWVERTLRRMTTDEKIGQVVFPTYFGGFTSTESETYRELLRRVEKDHIGGFILATRSSPGGIERSQVYATAELTNQLQKKARVPLLFCADFERGAVQRIVEGTPFPHLMAVAAAGRPQDAYTIGKISALEARAVGIHWIFAPVADVNSNPDNPIINIRSFGEDPQKVAEFVSAFVRGVEENGALATAKHFPGHGDTGTDSHLDMAKIGGDRARLEGVELVPFRAAIAAGASSIMTGHLVVPAIEPDLEVPATLSSNVLTGLLRDQMGFEGLVVTDALDMGGVTKGFPPGEVAVRALLAGADVLLMPPVPDAALMGLREAVKSGRIPMARLDAAVRRILQAKARLELQRNRLVDIDALNSNFRRPESLRLAQDIADRGVTLLRDDSKIVPLDPRKPARVLLLAVAADADTLPAEPFERELRSQLDTVQTVRVDPKYMRPETVHVPPLDQYDLAIVAMTVTVADRKATVGLPANEAEMVHALLKSGKPVVVASFGSPYLMEVFPEAQTWIAAFSTQDVSQRAVARALLGQIAISGKLPVRLPGAAPKPLAIGDGLTTVTDAMTLRPASPEMDAQLRPVYDLIRRAVSEDLLVACTLAVGHRGQLSLFHATAVVTLGTRNQPPVVPVTQQTNWEMDLGIPPILTTSVAVLTGLKRLSLDTPVWRILPEWSTGPSAEWRKKVTVRHLLEDTAGLPSFRENPSKMSGQAALLAQVSALALLTEPGARYYHSEWGQILLRIIVERLSGESLLSFANGELFAPIGESLSVATSGESSAGGPSVRSIAALAQTWMNGGIYSHRRLLHANTINEFLQRRQIDGPPVAAGWEVSNPPGHYFSSRAFGVNGFRRPTIWSRNDIPASVWIEPDSQFFIILQMSPKNGESDRAKLDTLLDDIHDAAFKALGLVPKS
jgi:beta-N-acetylhexosaminidase